jgi:HIV Tat-specific factor 1
MNYGFVDNTSGVEKSTEQKESEMSSELSTSDEVPHEENAPQMAGKKRKAQAPPPKWFEVPPEQNTKVYVSNLPNDTTEDEFGELMAKCGLIMKDLKTGKLKIKLYRDSEGKIKGDGLCHFIKVSLIHSLH